MNLNLRAKLVQLLITGALILQIACGGGSDNSTVIPQESVTFNKYVFALMYENVAWVDRQKGIFVNASGEVNYYVNPTTDVDFILNKDQFSSAELTTYFDSSATYLSTLDSAEFAAKKSLVDSIKDGPFGPLDHTCTDAGDFRYYAFDYDAVTDTYTPILIYRAGDFRMTNDASNIDQLKLWLMDFGLQNDIVYELNPGEDNFCTGM